MLDGLSSLGFGIGGYPVNYWGCEYDRGGRCSHKLTFITYFS